MDLNVLFIVSGVLLLVGVPIHAAMLTASFVYFMFNPGISLVMVMQRVMGSMNSFVLIAVPFFIFAGQIMNSGGITKRIFSFSEKLVGHFRGGLGHVNVLASLIFSGMSGSAMADVGGLGQIELKSMRDAGYDDAFALGITAASGTIGPIFPPSIPFIIYGAFMGVSIGALFIGGMLPGVILAIILGIFISFIAKRKNYPKKSRAPLREMWQSFKEGFLALITPLIIIGGILSGWFTPTEAAFICIFYALIIMLFVYKEIRFRDIPGLIIKAMKTLLPVVLIIIGATIFGWILQFENFSVTVASALGAITSSKALTMLIINIILLIAGMFIDSTAAIMLLVPIFSPICTAIGVHPIHLGVIVVLNLMIGLLTPPVGLCLYVLSSVSGYKVETMIKYILPWFIPLLIALFIVTAFEETVLFLPRLFGLV